MLRCSFSYLFLTFIALLLSMNKPAQSRFINANHIAHTFFLLKTAASQNKNLLINRAAAQTPADLNHILNKAKLNYNAGNYPVALKNALAAENIAQHQRNDTTLAIAGNLIGLIYIVRNNYAQAFPYLVNAAAINRKHGKINQLAANLLNLSMYYESVHQLERAIAYADSSLQLSNRVNRPDLAAMAANHLGDYYAQVGNEQKAIAYYKSVIQNKKFQSDWENSFAYTGLARQRLFKKDHQQAIQLGNLGFELAKKTKTKWDIQQALDILYKAYQQSGNYPKAFEYLNLYKIYSDSLFNDRKEQEINFLLLKEKEAENRDLKRLNQLNEQHQKINQMVMLIVSLVTILLFALLTLLYKRFIKSRKYNAALQYKTDKIEQKSKLINEQNLNLNQLNYTKDQLFSIIGHDLRSPFASILMALELFKSGDFDSDEINELAGKLHEQVAVTTKMLDNLLLWGSSQLGGLRTHHQTFDLAKTISGIVDVLKPVAETKQISISFDPLPNTFISADTDQVKVIVQNLITNAIKFTSTGGQIKVLLTNKQQQIEIAVCDSGVGMSPDTLHQLLRYGGKRVSTSGTAGERGIGLGLLLVKDFAEQNGATIQVQSELGRGTTFYVSFVKVTN